MTLSRFFRAPSVRGLVILPAMVALVSLGGCTQAQNNPKQTVGTVLGGVGGAVVGAQFGSGTGRLAATAAGALLGGFIGSEIGSSLDRADRLEAERAHQQALSAPVGQTINWNNPQSGHYGSVTPVRDGRTNTGEYCREYRSTIYVDGRQEQASGQACQQPDGTWRVIQ